MKRAVLMLREEWSWAASATLALAATAVLAAQPAPPTLLVVNARVFTGVASTPWADAIAVSGERIAAVGETKALRATAGASTRVIDAGGRLVIPGINDAHLHIGIGPPGISLDGPPVSQHDPTLEEVVARIRTAVARVRPGGWIYGEIGSKVLEDQRATRDVLDEAGAGHPVLLASWTGHGTIASSAVLRRVGVADDAVDPPGGFYGRDDSGRLNGRAHEYAEYMLRRRVTELAGEAALAENMREVSKAAAGFGITSLQMMSTHAGLETATRINDLAAAPQRVRVIDLPMTDIAAWRAPAPRVNPKDARFVVSGTKWILDGTPIERLMFLREPYADRPDTRGRLNFPRQDVEAFLRRALAAGEQPMFHASGDGAIEEVLGSLERTGGGKWAKLRPRLEHGDMLSPAQFDRLKRLGIVLVQNPSHFMLGEVMAARLGKRTSSVTMMKSALAAGVPVALGSDGLLNPYLNVMFASINANNPGEAMTREQAIVAYTAGSAFAEFQENEKGTLAAGRLADFAVLSQDIFTVAPDELPATVSVLTVVGGVIVHDALK